MRRQAFTVNMIVALPFEWIVQPVFVSPTAGAVEATAAAASLITSSAARRRARPNAGGVRAVLQPDEPCSPLLINRGSAPPSWPGP
jgi:hypothetical protein